MKFEIQETKTITTIKRVDAANAEEAKKSDKGISIKVSEQTSIIVIEEQKTQINPKPIPQQNPRPLLNKS